MKASSGYIVEQMRQKPQCKVNMTLRCSSESTLTSRNDSRVGVNQSPNVMRVVLKGSGLDPEFVLLSHSGGDELELDNGSFRRPGDNTALILSNTPFLCFSFLRIVIFTFLLIN